MTNLFEMMQAAQNGQAMGNIAKAYGLSQQQTQSAIEALLPAFSMGLQRQTQDPYAFGSMAQMMTASPFARMFDAGGGIPPQASAMGNDVLAQLFGSKDVSNAIAAQAAATSGVGQAILKQMMPVIAAMLMGGLFKSTSNQGMGGIFGQFTDMIQGQLSGRQAAPPPTQNPTSPMDVIFGGLFGNGQTSAPGQTQGGGPFGGAPMPSDPNSGGMMGGGMMGGGMLGQILNSMLGGAQDQRTAAPPPEPPRDEPAPSTETGPGSIGLDALNAMFEHGRQVQDDHQNALKSIFDAMLGGPNRR